MEILRTISFYTEDKDMPFILIGGHAVNVYGISRQTGDIDLVVPLSSKERWLPLLERLNYKCNQNDDRFARFEAKDIAAWPIDLMFVDDNTFKKLYSQSISDEVGVAKVRVASARHLVTLKLHALKNYQEHRYVKDLNDVLQLLKNSKTGISKTELSELCEKYADSALFDKLVSELDW